MRHLFKPAFILLLLFTLACSKEADPVADDPDGNEIENSLYFPESGIGGSWETADPEELGWNTTEESALLSLLAEKDTKAFIILKNGRVALEEYFGTFTQDSIWYWASAGKTLTAFTVGLAQEKDLLQLTDKTSDYLGEGWTGADPTKEDLITVWHQLTMTSGLNDLAFDCITSNCLTYKADAGERWAYHNGPYTLLQDVVATAAGSSYTEFFNQNLRNRIGMDGFWFSTSGTNSTYFSTARSMARYGLLILNRGKWDDTQIMQDSTYFDAMVAPSQDLNRSYGYLWWLNGKESFMAPASQIVFPGSLVPDAPTDMFAGLGKNDQKLYVVPSENLVIVRLGEDSGASTLGPSSFDSQLWQILKGYLNL